MSKKRPGESRQSKVRVIPGPFEPDDRCLVVTPHGLTHGTRVPFTRRVIEGILKRARERARD